jgi:hypothetical protein
MAEKFKKQDPKPHEEKVKRSPLDPGNFTGIDEWYEARSQLEKK